MRKKSGKGSLLLGPWTWNTPRRPNIKMEEFVSCKVGSVLRALAALAEDKGSVPSCLSFQCQKIWHPLLGAKGAACMWSTCTHVQVKHSYTQNKNENFKREADWTVIRSDTGCDERKVLLILHRVHFPTGSNLTLESIWISRKVRDTRAEGALAETAS